MVMMSFSTAESSNILSISRTKEARQIHSKCKDDKQNIKNTSCQAVTFTTQLSLHVTVNIYIYTPPKIYKDHLPWKSFLRLCSMRMWLRIGSCMAETAKFARRLPIDVELLKRSDVFCSANFSGIEIVDSRFTVILVMPSYLQKRFTSHNVQQCAQLENVRYFLVLVAS